MIAVLALLAGFLSCAARADDAAACQATTEVPDTLQVAWVSRLGARAGAHTALPVVRVADLRRLVETNHRDPTAVLRAIGALRPKAEAKGAWKVTVFDVKRAWLCRPVEGPQEATIAGVAACPGDLQGRPGGVRPVAWSGCGYLLDTASGARSLDVFRVEWETAVAWGFCVLPLRRFLDGA